MCFLVYAFVASHFVTEANVYSGLPQEVCMGLACNPSAHGGAGHH